MTRDPVLDRVARANPVREATFAPEPEAAARLRSGPPAAAVRRPVRWRSVAATVAGVFAITALVAVLPRGSDAPPDRGTAVSPAPEAAALVSIWVAPRATPADVDALRTRLDALIASGAADSVTYVSAAEALDELRVRLRDPSILEELPDNPMPASFRVKTSDPDALRIAIAGDPAIDPALGTSVTPRRSDPSVATP